MTKPLPVRVDLAFAIAVVACVGARAGADALGVAGLHLQEAAQGTPQTSAAGSGDGAVFEAETAPRRATQSTYLTRGTHWWHAGVGGASYFTSQRFEAQAYIGQSWFLDDRIEVLGEVALRGFTQDGSDAFGVNPSVIFRWHFWSSDDDATMTAFVDAGIGVMISTDDVPDDGTSFNFTPRFGGGVTYKLSDTLRLLAGVRWAHVSNARIIGNNDNPGTDGAMLHLGLIWEF